MRGNRKLSRYGDLQTRTSDISLAHEIEKSITDIFSSEIESFKSYVKFSTQYDAALKQINKTCLSNEKFKQFLDDVKLKDPEVWRENIAGNLYSRGFT